MRTDKAQYNTASKSKMALSLIDETIHSIEAMTSEEREPLLRLLIGQIIVQKFGSRPFASSFYRREPLR